jgi:hypothetical protein
VFLFRAGHSAREKASLGGRARDLAAHAIPHVRRAGNTTVHGVKQGVEGARGWAAPRLDGAADAITATVAPKVSSALHSAAQQVKPASARKTGIRHRLGLHRLDWRWMLGIGAALAAAGAAAGMTMRKRYESATADAREAAGMTADIPGQADAAAYQQGERQQEVNGRVTVTRN